MSFIIEYSNKTLKKYVQFSERRVPSPLVYMESHNTLISGDIFNISNEDVVKLDWKNRPEVLNEIEGNIAVLSFDNERCIFAVDMNGFDSFYYYHKGERFLVSDDFWDIVREIEPELSNINKEVVKYNFFEGGTFDGSTIVSGIKEMLPNYIISYDAKRNFLERKQFQEISCSGTCDDINVAVEHMDSILRNSMKQIKHKCGNVKYGVGISGGLDSRIISHYAKAEGMDVVGFNFCVPKPRRFLQAMSIKNAKKIADAFQVPFHAVSWNHRSVMNKILFSVKQFPSFVGNSFKFEFEGMPEFDVLLTGGSGFVVGSAVPSGLENWSKEQLVDGLFDWYGTQSKKKFLNRALRAWNYLFGIKLQLNKEDNSWLKEILVGKDYEEVIRRDLLEFVCSRYAKGMNSLEIYLDHLFNVVGFRNRRGAFESLFFTKRAFSIYVPFMAKETLTWVPRLLRNRQVLIELINRKIPEVADIGTESFSISPKVGRFAFVKKFITMIEFLFRGNGTAIDQYWMNKSSVRRQFLNYMNKDSHSWFHKLFGIEGNHIQPDMIKNESARLLVQTWELKVMLDCLEHKEYLKWS